MLPSTLTGLFPGRLWQVGLLVTATLTTLLLSMVPSFALGLLIDTVFERQSLRNLYILLGALVGCHVLEAAIRLARNRLAASIEQAQSAALKARLLEHLEHASLLALEATPASTVYNRMRSIGPIVAAYLDWYVTAISRPLFFLIAFCWLLVYSGMLGVAILALTLVYVCLYWLANRQLRSQYLQETRRRDRRSQLLHEFAQGMPFLRIAGLVRHYYEQMAVPASHQDESPTPGRLNGKLLAQLTDTYARLAFIGVLGGGAALVLRGQVTIGHLVAVIVIFRRVLSETRHVIFHIRRYYRTRAASTVIDVFLGQLGGAGAAGGTVPDFGAIVFDHVSFHYPDAARPALQDICLRIVRGQMVAIVGAPGSGKTSLLKLLVQLYAPSAGAVRYCDGDGSALHYSFMARSDMLFNGSIHQNIAFYRERSAADVACAAKRALAHDWISALGGQYRKRLANSGHDLSPGLKQRIALARCMAADAPLLLLDDPTSTLGPDSEARLLRNLREHRLDATIVLVTDRAAPALESDLVVFLDAGRVVQCGAPAQLQGDAGGAFARWCASHADNAPRVCEQLHAD